MNKHLLQAPVPLPNVAAPSLDGLSLVVGAPKVATPGDVGARLEELRRGFGVITNKKKGEAVGPSDEVLVDVVGYCDGKLVPRSPQFDQRLRLDQPLTYPEFGAALKLANVGDGLKVALTLPENFFVPALRGEPAVYLIDVKAARHVKLSKIDDPAFLAAVGAKTLPEALAKVAEELAAQYVLTASFQALQMAVDEVAKRVDVTLSATLVQQELWNLWREAEGKPLAEKGLVGQEQTESFEGWRDDPAVVADVTRRLRNTVVLQAIAEAHAGELTEARLVETAKRWVVYLGVPSEQIKAFHLADPATKKLGGTALMQLAAAELVLERSKVTFVDPAP